MHGLNNAHSIVAHIFFVQNMNSSLLEACSSNKTSKRDASTLNCSSGTKYIKKGRENSVEEKRKMRNSRKRRLRQQSVLRHNNKMKIKRLKEEKEEALKKAENSERNVSMLKCMVRTF